MKKSSIIILTALIFVSGCANKREELMKEYAESYYNTYMSGVTGLTEARITIENLENINKIENTEKYDLSSFEKCKKDSYVSLILKDKKIESYEFHLNC